MQDTVTIAESAEKVTSPEKEKVLTVSRSVRLEQRDVGPRDLEPPGLPKVAVHVVERAGAGEGRALLGDGPGREDVHLAGCHVDLEEVVHRGALRDGTVRRM